jgi:hypothetical protein
VLTNRDSRESSYYDDQTDMLNRPLGSGQEHSDWYKANLKPRKALDPDNICVEELKADLEPFDVLESDKD